MDLSEAAAPKSDQINADDLMSGPRVVTITEVRKGSSEQPVEIVTAEFGPGRPYRPGKSMIRVLINGWGADTTVYSGRRLTIYRDPQIAFGGQNVGGIRISHMSHIEKRMTLALTVTRGRRAPFVVEPLQDGPPLITPEQANEIAGQIAEAVDREALNNVGAQLKSFDLGKHRGELQGLWKERLAAITEAVKSEPEQGQLPADEAAAS